MQNFNAPTPSNPNLNESSGEKVVFDPSKALNLESVEALRDTQTDAYDRASFIYARHGLSDHEMNQITQESVENTVTNYLRDLGLSDDDSRYAEFKNALNDLSIISSPSSKWEKDNVSNPAESGQARAEAYYQWLVNGAPTPVEGEDVAVDQTSDDLGTGEGEVIEAEELTPLKLARTNLAQLSASRQRRIAGKGGEDYQEALKEYNDELIARGKEQLQEVLNDDTLNDAEKNKKVIEYLFEEQNKLRSESLAAVKDSKQSKIIDWFARKMDAKTTAGRIAKSIIFGAALGTAAAATLGLGGGVAAVVGVGIAAGTVKFSRAYAMREAKSGRGLSLADESVKQKTLEADFATPITTDNAFEEFQAQLNQNFESDVKKEQAKRRKSVAIAMGTVAAGTVLGVLAPTVIDAVGDNIHHFNPFKGFSNDGSGLPETAPPDAATGDADPATGSGSGAEHGAGTDAAPRGADLNGNGIPDNSEFVTDAQKETADIYSGGEGAPGSSEFSYNPNFSVDYGEGGIHFFQDLGLTESNWYEVQQELVEKFPDDFYSMRNGDVGLSHVGPLSTEAQQFITSKFASVLNRADYALAA